MRSYYRSFAAVNALEEMDREALLPYIWRQKTEISALYEIRPTFWVTLDYAIALTMHLLKSAKKTIGEPIQTILRPLYGRTSRELDTILHKVSEEEYGYLKHELKIFHHIVTHTINLVDKNLSHFIPQFLFISLIERMRLLYPLEERTVSPLLLAHGDYRLLLTRHLAKQFNKRLVGVIDFLLWYRETGPSAQPEHREAYLARFQKLVRESLEEPTVFTEAEGYSLREMIVELREAVTASLIAEKFMEIQNALSFAPADELLDAPRWLESFCGVFLPPTSDDRRADTIVRDLTIAEHILTDALAAAEAEDLDRLHRQILLAGSIRPFLQDVTAGLLPPKVALELDVFFEIMELLDHLYPDVFLSGEMHRAFRKTRQVLIEEIEQVKVTGTVNVSEEDILLFIDKAFFLRAREPRTAD